jgi:hypothetical protein
MLSNNLEQVLVVLSVINNMPLILPLSLLDCSLKGLSLL